MTTDAVETFVREARAYCSFVETAARLSVPERLEAARRHLLALYVTALELPAVEPDDSDATEGPQPPVPWPGFGLKDIYWEVFDPYDHDHTEAVAGSLDDDVLDTYRDIRRGLALWDASQKQDAIWEWRFHFGVHWGDHAIDALRALHRACKDDA